MKKIKQQIVKVSEARNFLASDYIEEMEKRANLTNRDFYRAQDSDSDELDDSELDSDDDAKSTGSWHHPNHKKAPTKREQYMNQLKRHMGPKDMRTSNFQ